MYNFCEMIENCRLSSASYAPHSRDAIQVAAYVWTLRHLRGIALRGNEQRGVEMRGIAPRGIEASPLAHVTHAIFNESLVVPRKRTKYGHSYYGTLIRNHMRSIKPCYSLWPSSTFEGHFGHSQIILRSVARCTCDSWASCLPACHDSGVWHLIVALCRVTHCPVNIDMTRHLFQQSWRLSDRTDDCVTSSYHCQHAMRRLGNKRHYAKPNVPLLISSLPSCKSRYRATPSVSHL